MGNSPAVGGRAPIHAFYSVRSWIEGNAIKQLEDVASLPGVKAVAGMPDLHPGKYGPVGCSVLADRISPLLVGSDIGCGMGLFQLDLAVRKLRTDKAAERLHALDAPWNGSVAEALAEAGLAPTPFDASLGTIVVFVDEYDACLLKGPAPAARCHQLRARQPSLKMLDRDRRPAGLRGQILARPVHQDTGGSEFRMRRMASICSIGNDDRLANVRFLTCLPSRTLSRRRYAGRELRFGIVSMCMTHAKP
jgi:hypothetical protein